MNAKPTVIFVLIFIIFMLPALCLASDGVQKAAIEGGQEINGRNNGQNSSTDVDAPVLSRYYGALSPQGETDLIIDQVQDLIDSGNISQKTGTYLQVMLETTKNKFDQGMDNHAINKLQVFIHLVNKFVHDGQLSKEDGQELIENARFLIEALQV